MVLVHAKDEIVVPPQLHYTITRDGIPQSHRLVVGRGRDERCHGIPRDFVDPARVSHTRVHRRHDAPQSLSGVGQIPNFARAIGTGRGGQRRRPILGQATRRQFDRTHGALVFAKRVHALVFFETGC